MRILSLFLLFFFFGIAVDAQVFWEDNFETTAPNLGGGIRVAPNHANLTDGSNTDICGANDYFFRTDCNTTSGTPGQNCDGITDVFTGGSGFMWRGEDLDGCIADPDILNFTGIDISGRSNLVFKGLFAADDDPNDWEGVSAADGHPDQLLVAYQIDGGGFTTGIVFRSDGSDHVNTEDDRGLLRVDTDNDGFGDGPLSLGTTFQEFSFNIPEEGSTLDLRFEAFVNGGGEEFAIDFFQLEEVPNPLVCPETGTEVGMTQTMVCTNEPFNITSVGLQNMAAVDNNDQNYGIKFVAFDETPANPYLGGLTIGFVTFNNLLADGEVAVLESASVPEAGNFTVYAILSPMPDDPSCRPFTTSMNLEVTASGSVTILSPGDFCINDIPLTGLSGGLPTGGIYMGPGVEDNGDGMTYNFNPAIAGIGTHFITYMNDCGTTAGVEIEVFDTPMVDFTPPGPFSEEDGLQTGLGGGTPTGGSYFGPGIIDDGNGLTFSFNPSEVGVGLSFVNYTYVDANGCGNTVGRQIEVQSTAPPLGNTCIDATALNDFFGQGLNVPQVTGAWDNANYTSTAADPSIGFECFGEPDGNGGSPSLERTIWYNFTGDGNRYKITTVPCDATNYIGEGDTQMALYSGECTNLTPVACNEDETGAPDFRSSIELDTELGVDYFLMIDGFGPDFPQQGEFCVEVIQSFVNSVTNLVDTDLRIFPNPTNGVIQLPRITMDRVEVVGATGRLMLNIEMVNNTIDLAAYPAGVYIVKMYAGEELYTAKLVKE